MKNIQRLIIIVTLILLRQNICEAQVFKLRAYQFSIKTYDKHYGWSDWSKWSGCKILITVDLYESRIKIYSQVEQEYDILEVEDQWEDNEGNNTLKCLVIDKDGERCNVRIVNDKNENRQIYVDYPDVYWVYNVYNLN